MSVPMNGNSHFWRRWRLIAVRLTIYVDHFHTILVSKSDSYRISEGRRGCGSWLLLQTLRACSDLNLIDSDLTCWGEFNGTRIATEAKAGRSESEVRRGSAIKTKLVIHTEGPMMRCIQTSEIAETYSEELSFPI